MKLKYLIDINKERRELKSCGIKYQPRYSTRYNHPDKRFLEVPQFCPSVHKSKNHFGHSFAFDAPTVWNHLPNEVRFTVHNPSELYVLVSSALPTTRRDMTCTVLKAT